MHGDPAMSLLALVLVTAGWATSPSPAPSPQAPPDVVRIDRSKPVPVKAEILGAWQRRQDRIRSFRFAWTEEQTHPPGWLPNPRLPQREWLDIPGLVSDRSYVVSKTLAVDGNRMRYSFELNRKEESDEGPRIVTRLPDLTADAKRQPESGGLGLGKHYVYTSAFDGQTARIRIASVTGALPPVERRSTANPDAQNLDTRAVLTAFRPLDPVMGHLLVDRAVTNQARQFDRDRSTFLLEEQRDPSGWKTILRLEPERDFLASRYGVYFEQKLMMDIEIDYTEDARWGWIPSGWRVSQRLTDGSTRVVATAKVTSYRINEPIERKEFQ